MGIVCAATGRSASWSAFLHGAEARAETLPPGSLAATGAHSTATGVSTTDALIYGELWRGPISYSFPDRASDYEAGYAEAHDGLASVSFGQMQAARYIFEGSSGYSGGPRAALTPVEGFTSAVLFDAGFGRADIRIAESDSGGQTAYTYLPSGEPSGGDVWFGREYDYSDPGLGTYSFATMIHELGHSLGLKHAHEGGGLTGQSLPLGRDSLEYSVMTYRSYVPSPGQAAPSVYTNETYGYPQTFMMHDIAALQSLYGANFAFRSTNTVYSWSRFTGETFVNGVGMGAPGDGAGGDANRILLTIWDGGGSDTYDFSNYTSRVVVSLEPGGASALRSGQRAYLGDGHSARANVFNALLYQGDPRSLIENATGGSGSDVLVGNAAANRLRGRAGNDVLSGKDGSDVLSGGPGDDVFVFSTPPHSSSDVDRIADFTPRDDTIRLKAAAFPGLGHAGPLASWAFRVGPAAADSSDRIIYDKGTGALFYDPDGSGPGLAVQFLELATKLRLTAADFLIG